MKPVQLVLLSLAITLAVQAQTHPEIVVTLRSPPFGLNPPRIEHIGRDAAGNNFRSTRVPGYPPSAPPSVQVWRPNSKTSERYDRYQRFIVVNLGYYEWPGSFRNPNGRCELRSDPSNFKYVGLEELLPGLKAHHYRHDDGPARLDVWFAPEVDCYPVKQTSTLRDRDEVHVSVSVRPISVVYSGASKYTVRPKGYEEISVVEAARRQYIKIFGSLEKAPKGNLDDLKRFEKDYHERKARGLVR